MSFFGMSRERPGGLSHVDERGAARMVDVGDKAVTSRVAIARSRRRIAALSSRMG